MRLQRREKTGVVSKKTSSEGKNQNASADRENRVLLGKHLNTGEKNPGWPGTLR